MTGKARVAPPPADEPVVVPVLEVDPGIGTLRAIDHAAAIVGALRKQLADEVEEREVALDRAGRLTVRIQRLDTLIAGWEALVPLPDPDDVP